MDPYRVLGVDINASDDDIKRAYRKLAKQYHPDVNKAPGAEEKFKQVQSAYDAIMTMRKKGTSYQQSYGNNYNNGYGNYSQYQDYGSQTNYASEYQAVANFINSGYFAEAQAVLNRIPERTGMWYYYSAIVNMGLRNMIQAKQDAHTAVSMEPNNMQYQSLYQRLQSPQNAYSFYSQPFGRPTGNDMCCRILQYYLICQCMSGGCFYIPCRC